MHHPRGGVRHRHAGQERARVAGLSLLLSARDRADGRRARSRGRPAAHGKIQAYVGNAPRFATAPPNSIDSIESLGSFVIVRVNPASPKAKDEQSACAIAETVVRDLAGKGGDFVAHPYPVTPFNGDYLHYVDLAETAKARILGGGTVRWIPTP